MVGCQNYGPFLGTLNIRCRSIIGIQKGTVILTTTQMGGFGELGCLFAVNWGPLLGFLYYGHVPRILRFLISRLAVIRLIISLAKHREDLSKELKKSCWLQ